MFAAESLYIEGAGILNGVDDAFLQGCCLVVTHGCFNF
jgi:hypothetical protein